MDMMLLMQLDIVWQSANYFQIIFQGGPCFVNAYDTSRGEYSIYTTELKFIKIQLQNFSCL